MLSTLALFMLRVLANNHDSAVALDDLAFLAHRLHGRSDFHMLLPPTCFSRLFCLLSHHKATSVL